MITCPHSLSKNSFEVIIWPGIWPKIQVTSRITRPWKSVLFNLESGILALCTRRPGFIKIFQSNFLIVNVDRVRGPEDPRLALVFNPRTSLSDLLFVSNHCYFKSQLILGTQQDISAFHLGEDNILLGIIRFIDDVIFLASVLTKSNAFKHEHHIVRTS